MKKTKKSMLTDQKTVVGLAKEFRDKGMASQEEVQKEEAKLKLMEKDGKNPIGTLTILMIVTVVVLWVWAVAR